MSKRHRKSKITLSSQSSDEDIDSHLMNYDLSMYETPKGKKPKGRQKRANLKRAYYDD